MDQEYKASGQPAGGPSKQAKIAVTVAVLVLAVITIFGIRALSANDAASTTRNAGTSEQPSVSSSTESTSNGEYKNGTYRATGSYATPEGVEEITVNMTVQDGRVSETTATASGRARESRQYQSQFIEAYRELVVGKSLDEVRLSRVSGSSLTSQGFNKAVEAIKEEASTQG